MGDTTRPAYFQLSDKTYDVLSGLVKYVLPGVATFYLALATLWVLPFGEQIAGTIMAITTLLGVILGISKKAYLESAAYEGDILVDVQEEGSDLLTLALSTPVDDIKKLNEVKFRVVRHTDTQE